MLKNLAVTTLAAAMLIGRLELLAVYVILGLTFFFLPV